MSTKCRALYWATVVSSVVLWTGSVALASGDFDFDGGGYVDLGDYVYFEICFSLSGPNDEPGFQECVEQFDSDDDGDVDLVDYSAFMCNMGHLPIPLRDLLGNQIRVDSATPYSGRQTCGTTRCHDVEYIANGTVFQQGRTDVEGNIVMQDDFFDDGRWWVRSDGMYGRWSGGGGGLNRQTSGKENANESVMDMTPFYWTANCGGCHAGGGGAEFDRDGERFWDEITGQFGYEVLGKDPSDVLLDGDYAVLDDTDGSVRPAPWDITGVADPECLHCHRAKRTWVDGKDMHRQWRAEVLGTTTELVDEQGESVPAFASAGTAGQGWFSTLDTDVDPPVLQIDYSVGVASGDLGVEEGGELFLAGDFLARPPRDQACWGCHLPGGFQNKRGTVWFDERDVHFKKFTNRSDDNPSNDLTDAQATVCNQCHPNDLSHNFAKGDSPYAQFRNETDWDGFRSCRECHLTELSPGVPNLNRHPDAPHVPGEVIVHLAGEVDTGPMANVSCQGCHVAYPLKRAVIVTDRSLTGTAEYYFTEAFLSADPLDPDGADKSKWFPALVKKVDSDGRVRLFPQKREVAIYWADWDRMGTPSDLSDDTIQPIILWRIRQITGGVPLPGVSDDNGDGRYEINRPSEILTYIIALRGNDSYGRPVANNPVLVKGERVWYFDPQASEGVSWFEPEGTGIAVQTFETFGLDHNVLVKEESLGFAEHPPDGCNDCHRPDTLDSPVFDRLVLVDPWGTDGEPTYQKVRDMTGLNPP